MFGVLRTLLAINVVLLHIFNVPTLGNYSVSFFFILSGFLMTLIMQETYGYTLKGFKVFWINRVLRLYPIYFFILIITIFALFLFPNIVRPSLMFLPKTLIGWIANISMIYPKFIPHRFEPILSPASWALTNELIFYLLIALGISKSKIRTMFWVLISVGYYLGTYLFYDIATYRYSAIFASSLPFALGASLYWFNKSFTRKKIYKKTIIMFGIVFLYILFIINAIYSNSFTTFFKEFTIYFNIIIAIFLTHFLYNIKINKKLKSIDTYIGLYSYPIYLSHFLVALIYSGTIDYGVIEGDFKMRISALLPYFLLLLVFCSFIVHLIDIKVNNFKKRLKNKIVNKQLYENNKKNI